MRAFLSLVGVVAASTASQETCDVAIAGGGPGGIYFAWRLLTAGVQKSICMYERSDRFGGRIFSLRKQGPKQDLVVDLGAYRYAPEPYQEGDWYIYTPLLGGLIDKALKLPSMPYEPGNVKSTVRKIVDSDGQNAGYATFVEAMHAELITKYSHLFSLQLNEELVSLSPMRPGSSGAAGGNITLSFASGLSATAAQVLLNLPQLPLLKVLDKSEGLFGPSGMPPALQVPTPLDGAKLYVYYENAWWINLLNLTSGEFGPDIHNTTTRPLGQLPELSGRYHDGHTRCDGPSGGFARCRGYLEATYTYGMGARFFLNHEPRTEPPYTELHDTTPTGRFALELVHKVLLRDHQAALDALSAKMGKNMTAVVVGLKPKSALLSYWGPQTTGYGGAIHMTRPGTLMPEQDLAPSAMAPFGDALPVYVANEAFGALRGAGGALGTHHGWAECSLVMAENVLASKFGVPPPSWMSSSVYDQYVKFHTAPEERARRNGWHQG